MAATGAPALAPVEEKELVARLRAGEQEAFRQLVLTHGGRMLQVARRYLREEDARDAVQDAFLSAFRAIDRFDGKARISTWLHRIVVNSSLMRRRKKSAHPEEPIEPLLPAFLEDGHRVQLGGTWEDSAEELLGRAEMRTLVRRSIDRLPEGHRTVLLLRDIDGLSGAETAALLGIKPNAVKVRLHRARLALRELLDPHLGRGVA